MNCTVEAPVSFIRANLLVISATVAKGERGFLFICGGRTEERVGGPRAPYECVVLSEGSVESFEEPSVGRISLANYSDD